MVERDDPTVASAILVALQSPSLFATLETKFKEETFTLQQSLENSNKSGRGNDVAKLLAAMKHFNQGCTKKKTELTPLEHQTVNDFTSLTLIDLYELYFNVNTHKIILASKTDAYTLNHTCYFILVLEDYINDLDKTSFETSPKKQKITTFYEKKEPCSLIQQELDIARKLRKESAQIRSQIGSPEVMPKGLVITFMCHLCEALLACRDAYRALSASNRQLLRLIGTEIENLKHTYPDLAKAGEDLQKAVANYQPSKP